MRARVNIICWDNGAGLSTDIAVLRQVLEAAGAMVQVSGRSPSVGRRLRPLWGRRPEFDVNLHVESPSRRWLPHAVRNVLLPNPEWLEPTDLGLVARMDAVFTKTHHAGPLFLSHGIGTHHVGFTSPDHHDAETPWDWPPVFLHIGRSVHKGSDVVVDCWESHPEWPALILLHRPAAPGTAPLRLPNAANIHHYVHALPKPKLRNLLNRTAFHLRPSRAEGFGHALVEAMSCGGVVITTDAPPMNEIVTPERGILIPSQPAYPMGIATAHSVLPEALEAAVEQALRLGFRQARTLGGRARAWYLETVEEFPKRLVQALQDLGIDGLSPPSPR